MSRRPAAFSDRAPVANSIRFAIDPRDVPPIKIARLFHLSLEGFNAWLPELRRRGFPAPRVTGNYDLKAVHEWMDADSRLTARDRPSDAKAKALARIGAMGNGHRDA